MPTWLAVTIVVIAVPSLIYVLSRKPDNRGGWSGDGGGAGSSGDYDGNDSSSGDAGSGGDGGGGGGD